jgi:hypothetical protein
VKFRLAVKAPLVVDGQGDLGPPMDMGLQRTPWCGTRASQIAAPELRVDRQDNRRVASRRSEEVVAVTFICALPAAGLRGPTSATSATVRRAMDTTSSSRSASIEFDTPETSRATPSER